MYRQSSCFTDVLQHFTCCQKLEDSWMARWYSDPDTALSHTMTVLRALWWKNGVSSLFMKLVQMRFRIFPTLYYSIHKHCSN